MYHPDQKKGRTQYSYLACIILECILNKSWLAWYDSLHNVFYGDKYNVRRNRKRN